MSDNLRDRIESALDTCWDRFGVTDHRLMADAVIAELGLIRQTHCQDCDNHRYVTEWTADE